MASHTLIETFFNTCELKRFSFPGKLFWGVDCRNEMLPLIDSGSVVDFVYDKALSEDPFVRSFLLKHSKKIRISFAVSGAPSPQAIEKIAASFPRAADFLVVLGGGSTLDFAKGMIVNWLYGDVYGVGVGERRGVGIRQDARRPVFIALPTTAGSGAESSRYYVLYDSETRAKVHGKSWELVADYIFLDPYFLRHAPFRLILHGAFDAFVHLLESYLCQYEKSWFGDMLTVSTIPRIIASMSRVKNPDTAEDAKLHLMYSATIGGMAISNIRTGHIHEAAGALLEKTNLTHAETLLVFLRSACEFYGPSLDKSFDSLWKSFAQVMPISTAPAGLVSLAVWWEREFEAAGAMLPISEEVTRVRNDPGLLSSIAERVRSDKVWTTKESPIYLDGLAIDKFVSSSIERFTIHAK